jgi:serine/threonine protein kinase
VALKLLPEFFSGDQEYLKRFQRESLVAARLREPHVIPIHDFGEVDGRLFIDMRLVDGIDIRMLLDDNGPIAPQRAVNLLSQVAQALDAAHADGLVHRDIKPSNILVTSSDFVYAVDFGIARPIGGRQTSPTITGATIGSNVNPGGLIQKHPGALVTRHGKYYQEESDNWSGYATTGGTDAFNSVSANWTEPTANCDDSGTEYAAFWVGLDGFNSDSVEQTGTDSDCDGGTPDYYGWYEMYPADPVYFNNPVYPGDSMSASVVFTGTGTYTLTLTDNTQGWTQQEVENEVGLDNSSAEVITEAPSTEDGPLPLADFGTVDYATATVNGQYIGALDPTQIIMVGQSGDQLDTTSSLDNYGDFNNTWEAES